MAVCEDCNKGFTSKTSYQTRCFNCYLIQKFALPPEKLRIMKIRMPVGDGSDTGGVDITKHVHAFTSSGASVPGEWLAPPREKPDPEKLLQRISELTRENVVLVKEANKSEEILAAARVEIRRLEAELMHAIDTRGLIGSASPVKDKPSFPANALRFGTLSGG